MKTIIAFASMILIFSSASANSLTCPADKPESPSKSESTVSEFMLDSLQASSEKTPFKDFTYMGERIKQKLMDMEGNACDQKN